MNRPLVLLFGGQSSRDAGMFDRLGAADARIGAQARARAVRHVAGDPTDFSANRTIQVSVLAVTLGWLDVTRAAGLRSTASAGLSLGEYAHLVDIGALDADDAIDLVAARGALYDDGPAGAMAAVFPASWDALEPIVWRIAHAYGGEDALAPAVFSSPAQTVVAGSRPAVDALMEAAEAELYARSVVVEDRIPMHAPLFAPVAAQFHVVLQDVRWRRARAIYRPNVTGRPADARPRTLVDCLTRHVCQAVRWRDTVDALVRAYPDAVFLEVGPRTVLRDLMRRRWHAARDVFAVDEPADGGAAYSAAATTLAAVRAALPRGPAERAALARGPAARAVSSAGLRQ